MAATHLLARSPITHGIWGVSREQRRAEHPRGHGRGASSTCGPPVLSRAAGRDSTRLTLDFVEEIRIYKLMNALLVGIGIHQPGRGGNTTQQGISILWRKAEASNFMPIAHRHRRYRDHRLIQNAAKEPLIAAKGEDRVGHGFFGQ